MKIFVVYLEVDESGGPDILLYETEAEAYRKAIDEIAEGMKENGHAEFDRAPLDKLLEALSLDPRSFERLEELRNTIDRIVEDNDLYRPMVFEEDFEPSQEPKAQPVPAPSTVWLAEGSGDISPQSKVFATEAQAYGYVIDFLEGFLEMDVTRMKELLEQGALNALALAIRDVVKDDHSEITVTAHQIAPAPPPDREPDSAPDTTREGLLKFAQDKQREYWDAKRELELEFGLEDELNDADLETYSVEALEELESNECQEDGYTEKVSPHDEHGAKHVD